MGQQNNNLLYVIILVVVVVGFYILWKQQQDKIRELDERVKMEELEKNETKIYYTPIYRMGWRGRRGRYHRRDDK